MIRITAVALFALAGCATTSIGEIRSREVQDRVTVAGRSVQQVRDCLVEALSALRTPIETGTPERRELTFKTDEAGAIFFYTLTAADGGVLVEARRKNALAEGFKKGRQCYMPEGR